MTRKSSPDGERHDFHFQGAWVPPAAFALLVKGKLNHSQLALVLLISALSKPGGKGCWASNSYIAKSLGVVPLYVSQMVSKLVKLKVLKSAGKGKARRLKTNWQALEHIAPGYREPIVPNYTRTNTKDKRESTDRAATRPVSGKKESGDMSFLPLKKANAGVTPRHRILARKLHKAVCDRTCYKKPIKLDAWSKVFAKLDQEVGQARVDQAIDWYALHVGDEYIPEAFVAKSFRSKFAQIESAMKRQQKKPNLTTINITPEAKKAAEFINNQRWERGGKNLLPAIQLSIDNFRKFYAKVFSMPVDNGLSHFRDRLKSEFTGTVQFAVDWFQGVRDRWENWSKWHGDLMKHVFVPEADQFQEWGKSISVDFSDSPAMWNQLMEAYRRANS